MLHGIKLKEALETNNISCESTIPDEHPFVFGEQVSEDSIDLRLSDYGYVMNNKYEYINTLSALPFDKFFEKVKLPENGYILKPGEILFAPTLERVCIKKTVWCGYLVGRSIFSRMGLSVHCTQSKFTTGMNSIVPLQLKNENNGIALKIFPYQKIAQLIIEPVQTERGEEISLSESQFANEKEYILPNVLEKDRCHYKNERIKEIFIKDIPGLNQAKIIKEQDKKIEIIKDYLLKSTGEYKTTIFISSSMLISTIIAFLALPRGSDSMLPISSWVFIIIAISMVLVYSVYKYFRINHILRESGDQE
jgi:deoxycytidine triphosphate deaminase